MIDTVLALIRDEVGQEPASWLALADLLAEADRPAEAALVLRWAVPPARCRARLPHLRPAVDRALASLAGTPLADLAEVDAAWAGVPRPWRDWVARTPLDEFLTRADRLPGVVLHREAHLVLLWLHCRPELRAGG